MNADLKHFIVTVLGRAVLPTLLLVTTVAFFSVPYSLGHHPGEEGGVRPVIAHHMT
jgi:hypothetical protein